MTVPAFLYGLGVGFSLILAIGAQNAFVLKQGIKRQFVFAVCFICALSDALLIFAGVFGFGEIVERYPWIAQLARYFGALFLLAYGLRSFYSAFSGQNALIAQGEDKSHWWQVVLTCLAFTWLNPHVYLDTVVLIGAISAQFPEEALPFALGAACASWAFFFALGYGARLLRPVFANPKAWKILDALIGVVMWSIAASLLFGSQ